MGEAGQDDIGAPDPAGDATGTRDGDGAMAPILPQTAKEPAERLQNALNRIAYGLERRMDAARPPSGVDLPALAANIDVLIARIRDMLGPDSDGKNDAPGRGGEEH